MKKYLVLIFLSVSLYSCRGQDCNQLPEKFTSYSTAVKIVNKCSFRFQETANTSNSSWITSAKYYSCDGHTGYLIYTTNKGYEYIHQGVPKSLWEGFKNASSKGSYYNARIKNRYQVKLQ